MVCSENITYITGVIVTYWAVSITMVYLNKFLMTNDGISIPAPLFITWYQCIITSFICYVAGYFGDRAQKQMLNNAGNDAAGLYSKLSAVDLDSSISGVVNGASNGLIPNRQPGFISQFPKATYRPSIALRIFPLSLIFVGMITFNNLCLTFVQVSFYNVARSLTIVFNIFLSWMILGIRSSVKTVACLVIVMLGFYIGCQGELNYSTIGTNCGVISSLFVSLNSIYTKCCNLQLQANAYFGLPFYEVK